MSRPTSTRRWPDILIGVLVLLLLAGFAALLLGQRKTAGTTTPTATASATSSIPAAPGTAEGNTATPDTETTAITPPAADPAPAADTGSAATAPADAAPADTAPTDTVPADTAQATPAADTTTEAPIIPAAPTPTPQATPDAAASTDTQPAATSAAETPAPQTETPQAQITETPTTPPAETPAATAAPRSGGAVTTSESRTPLRSDYRISLGSFGSVGTARSRTAPVSTLGYTVYPIDLGSQVVAQVGPFADEASARQALGDIQRAYPGALLYPPRAKAGTAPSTSDNSTPRNSSGSSASSSAPAATPAPTPDSIPATALTPAADSPIYLQVGAFDRVESAQKVVQQLRDLGYVPTVNAPDGRKVTVAVGPYKGDALTRTEQRLDDNNLDHFRVR